MGFVHARLARLDSSNLGACVPMKPGIRGQVYVYMLMVNTLGLQFCLEAAAL